MEDESEDAWKLLGVHIYPDIYLNQTLRMAYLMYVLYVDVFLTVTDKEYKKNGFVIH